MGEFIRKLCAKAVLWAGDNDLCSFFGHLRKAEIARRPILSFLAGRNGVARRQGRRLRRQIDCSRLPVDQLRFLLDRFIPLRRLLNFYLTGNGKEGMGAPAFPPFACGEINLL